MDAHRHVAVAPEARRAARRARRRRGVARLGARAIGQGRDRSRSTPRCGPSAAAGRWPPSGRGSAGSSPPSTGRATQRRGQVALSQDEAWELMTVAGPTLAAVGFDVRVPTLSRRKATPSLRLFAESPARLGGRRPPAQQRGLVRAVRRRRAHRRRRRPARQAGPPARPVPRRLGRGRSGRPRAGRGRARRARADHQLTGAEILRHSIGLDGSGLRGGVDVHGNSWANDILRRAGEASTSPVTRPEGFAGELRTYQAEALAWIGFLDAADLGGCLALDMGLGKTPTVLAHLARTASSGTALVIAPAAVVGNWAAEAARFVPGLRVVVHHGASRRPSASCEARSPAPTS